MISIKKHLESWATPQSPSTPQPAAADPALDCYVSLLSSVGKSASRSEPEIGSTLEKDLVNLGAALRGSRSNPDFPLVLENTHREVQTALTRSTDATVARHKQNQGEIREIVTAVTNAVETLTSRDERYKSEVGDLTARLHSITEMNDLGEIRKAIVESANTLTACVDRAVEAGKESLKGLKAEIEEYRSRLTTYEKLSSLDALTGLANRRGFEELMQDRMNAGIRFCLILMDLNGFKGVNDRLGHLAGDEVLKTVAAKLRLEFSSADLVARWGGDEFAVILTCSQRDALARVSLIGRSPVAECTFQSDGRPVDIRVQASFGVVEWNGSESGPELLARADSCMYRGKQSRR